MKQAAKVFIWIGMISQCILIFPIIFGILALKKINSASSKKDLQTLGFLTIFFCSTIGGIFMLNIKEDDLLNNKEENRIINNCAEITITDNISEKKGVKIFTQIVMYAFCVLLPINIILASLWNEEIFRYEDFQVVIIVLSVGMSALFIPVFMLFHINNLKFKKTNFIMFFIFTIISFITMVVSFLISILECIDYDLSNGGIFSPFCSINIYVLSIIVLILNRRQSINEPTNISTEHVITNKLELELNEAARLYNSNVIKEVEYKKIRESIITKYYK